jgi:tRNA pseudouridine55 synthase
MMDSCDRTLNGFLNINKPPSPTSHDVVDEIRRLIPETKVGHTGTLDPGATGVLPVAIGKATKVIRFLRTGKGYRAIMRLGITTDTQDMTGKLISEQKSISVPEEKVRGIFSKFLGKIEQVPPMVSALKVGGKRLYKLAREGKNIERRPRTVDIYSLKLLSYKPPEITFEVSCSQGTYIRTLCHDMGSALGVGACLRDLVRTRSGLFTLEESHALEECKNIASLRKLLVTVDQALSHLAQITVQEGIRESVLHGQPPKGGGIAKLSLSVQRDELVRIYDSKNQLLAIAKALFAIRDLQNLDRDTVVLKLLKVLG